LVDENGKAKGIVSERDLVISMQFPAIPQDKRLQLMQKKYLASL